MKTSIAGIALAAVLFASERPVILKLGTIDCDMVETTPVVFRNKLYRFEYVRKGYWANPTGASYFRFIDKQSGAPGPAFARGYHFGSAFIDGGKVYVTGTSEDGRRVDMFVSKDLLHWERRTALDLPGWKIFNTSIAKAPGRYVLMFEISEPRKEAGVPFTARFAVSKDMRTWRLTSAKCAYSRDRYTAPHCLRYLDGYFYNFYLERFQGWEMRVVRSRDLVTWEASPLNPVLRASEDDRKIANPELTTAQRRRIAEAVDVNNSDIDFCEYRSRLVIDYSWGNQRGVEHLAEATYNGTLKSFLRAWFPAPPH